MAEPFVREILFRLSYTLCARSLSYTTFTADNTAIVPRLGGKRLRDAIVYDCASRLVLRGDVTPIAATTASGEDRETFAMSRHFERCLGIIAVPTLIGYYYRCVISSSTRDVSGSYTGMILFLAYLSTPFAQTRKQGVSTNPT